MGLEADAARKSTGTTQRPAAPGRVAEGLDGGDPAPLDQVAGHALHEHPPEPAATLRGIDVRHRHHDGVRRHRCRREAAAPGTNASGA